MANHEVQVQQKREVEKKAESTVSLRSFLPVVDIFETDHALKVVLEMPGVDKESVEVGVENDVLTITGRIDVSKYEGLRPLYTEYNIGNYSRSFQISNRIDQNGIKADLTDGVVTIGLPKSEKAKPRRIAVEGARGA